VVAGLSAECTAAATAFLHHLADPVVPVSSIATAELVKVFENAFRLVNISLVNELAELCRATGVDVHELIDAAATKPFGFLTHRPGPGAGGDCVPVAARFLARAARRHGVAASVVTAATTVNDTMPDLVINRVAMLLACRHLPDVWDSRVLVVGVTYKPDVPNIRGSAAIRIIERLRAGTAVGYADPYVPQVRLADGSLLFREQLDPTRADLVLVVTKHRAVDHAALNSSPTPVVDCSDGLPRLLNHCGAGVPSDAE
jgi:UDP-N-acetyl-D-glucosamine dehydrogenase